MYRFKQAETEAEFEQIFRLNHSVFAAELCLKAAEERVRLPGGERGREVT